MLGEPELGELAQDEVAVDPLAVVEGRVVQPGQLRLPAVDEREQPLAAGLGEVGPAVVVAVVADAGGDVRQEDEQLIEEAGDDGLEAGHGHLRVWRDRSGRAGTGK